MERSDRSNAPLFWGVLASVVGLDVVTKWLAVDRLSPLFGHVELLGDWLRLTLVYNPGAAFGLSLGAYSRWIFMALTVGALAILWRLFVGTARGDLPRVLAIALVSGGALGNLIDRVRSPAGVVDFIDVGIGASRWPTFNIADMAVSTGAFLLAWVLWREEREAEAAERAMASGVVVSSAGAMVHTGEMPVPGAGEPRDVA